MSNLDRGRIYAILGNACQSSLSTIVSNTKFLPVDDPVYNMVYTHTHLYPGHENSWNQKELKDEKEKEKEIKENYVSRPYCCGRK